MNDILKPDAIELPESGRGDSWYGNSAIPDIADVTLSGTTTGKALERTVPYARRSTNGFTASGRDSRIFVLPAEQAAALEEKVAKSRIYESYGPLENTQYIIKLSAFTGRGTASSKEWLFDRVREAKAFETMYAEFAKNLDCIPAPQPAFYGLLPAELAFVYAFSPPENEEITSLVPLRKILKSPSAYGFAMLDIYKSLEAAILNVWYAGASLGNASHGNIVLSKKTQRAYIIDASSLVGLSDEVRVAIQKRIEDLESSGLDFDACLRADSTRPIALNVWDASSIDPKFMMSKYAATHGSTDFLPDIELLRRLWKKVPTTGPESSTVVPTPQNRLARVGLAGGRALTKAGAGARKVAGWFPEKPVVRKIQTGRVTENNGWERRQHGKSWGSVFGMFTDLSAAASRFAKKQPKSRPYVRPGVAETGWETDEEDEEFGEDEEREYREDNNGGGGGGGGEEVFEDAEEDVRAKEGIAVMDEKQSSILAKRIMRRFYKASEADKMKFLEEMIPEYKELPPDEQDGERIAALQTIVKGETEKLFAGISNKPNRNAIKHKEDVFKKYDEDVPFTFQEMMDAYAKGVGATGPNALASAGHVDTSQGALDVTLAVLMGTTTPEFLPPFRDLVIARGKIEGGMLGLTSASNGVDKLAKDLVQKFNKRNANGNKKAMDMAISYFVAYALINTVSMLREGRARGHDEFTWPIIHNAFEKSTIAPQKLAEGAREIYRRRAGKPGMDAILKKLKELLLPGATAVGVPGTVISSS